MIGPILLWASGIFMVSTGWYAWQETGGFMALMFGMAGTLLLTLGVMIVAGGMR